MCDYQKAVWKGLILLAVLNQLHSSVAYETCLVHVGHFAVFASFTRESTSDARNVKGLSPDKQNILNDVKKCMMPDFSQCMGPTQMNGMHTPVPVKLEVEDASMMAVSHADSIAPVSANEYSHGLQDNHMLTTLTNSLVGL